MNKFSINKVLALVRDEYKCQGCGIESNELHAHHIKPRRIGGTDDLDNLVSLCAKCHPKAENALPATDEKRKQIRNVQNIYFTQETYAKLERVAELYNIKPRKSRTTHKPTVNLSATIDRALDIAIAAAQEQEKSQ